tara:strand:+ start:566 stop:1018 length:453 start_codon:yes stop_codon:yes gene_type:complete
MAITKVPAGSQVLIKVGDGASPEVFAHPCLVNLSREISFSHNYQEQEIPVCEDTDQPHSIERQVRSVDMTVTGSGVLDAAGIDEYLDWCIEGTQKNVQIQIGPSTSGRTITGAFFCQFNVSGEVKQSAECSITLTPVSTLAANLVVAAVS